MCVNRSGYRLNQDSRHIAVWCAPAQASDRDKALVHLPYRKISWDGGDFPSGLPTGEPFANKADLGAVSKRRF